MIRILLVEDDKDDQFFFKNAVDEIHPKIVVHIVESGAEAIAQMDDLAPDIIVSDYNMPIMNAYHLWQAIARIKPGIPFITMSANANLQPEEGFQPTYLFEKPDSYDGLKELLSRLITGDLAQNSYPHLALRFS